MDDKKKKILVCLIVVAVFLLISAILNFCFNKEEHSESSNTTSIEQKEDTNDKGNTNIDESKEIDEQELVKDDRLTLNLHKVIKEKIDEEKLKSSLANYLEENQLYTEDTTLTSEEMIIEYLDKGTFQFTLLMNNSTGRYITVDVDKQGNFTFSSR